MKVLYIRIVCYVKQNVTEEEKARGTSNYKKEKRQKGEMKKKKDTHR